MQIIIKQIKQAAGLCVLLLQTSLFFIFYICANSISISKFISKDLVFLLCYRKPLYTYKGLFWIKINRKYNLVKHFNVLLSGKGVSFAK